MVSDLIDCVEDTVRGKRYARGCVEQSVMLGNERD